ncbi:hypothetical protein ACIQWR_31310 [Streptomyces sp. NPDC098789]|uniref:hypothetical protein n=1 Tax=Streptomyces sp. NPDC098789 TaxID=3366098 RepID=UPI003821A36B
MSVFAVLFLAAAVLFSVAIVLYLRVGFRQRCAPVPLTAVAGWAAWDVMQVLGFLRTFGLEYFLEPGFLVVEGLLLYLCFAHRARHRPAGAALGSLGYALLVFVLSCAAIVGLSGLLDDPGGLIGVSLVAVLFPAMVVLERMRGHLRAGQQPVAAVLWAASITLVLVAVVADPPSGSRSGPTVVVCASVLLVSVAYAWVVVTAGAKGQRSARSHEPLAHRTPTRGR